MYFQFTQVLLYLLISSNIVMDIKSETVVIKNEYLDPQIVTTYQFFLYNRMDGHPIKEHGKKVGIKDEKKYPNGTVVGKYSYKDKDGNPIHVKYFADDSSYGVELKSVKVFGNHPELLKNKLNFETMTADPSGSLDIVNAANSLINKEFHLNKSYNPYEILNYPKERYYKGNKKPKDLDYEIFLENEFQPSEKCAKEKIRVYSDKTRRKIREVAHNNNNNKFFCERY